ncbi:adaptor protein, phosphotyrosine interacting with PH domain and leucine zipper 2 [Homo sapiens]|uniref:DCC-interacting protein 13-beta n=3 Tax=Homininae TaxID=207598 RepID=G3RBH7_GORGO|nr:DCC-interacting protein 13-beta isoform 2 [Homo sapiens]KAI2567700.1 adaptor protein, phosphotyrosine interacting with PH domain and leucine zipper 2 [Homo sapiens]KAI4067952.1 adaptor protein, phosphotyrosine interacting with PH domain and leucine zipper 2 [Homo sapiens]|eukprot:NP_001238833.1 DCC-interacting protein 13-beta isoform 2 [Homo sapiens]
MPAVDKLLLEEALQDSPQTRSLLSVFEEDAGTLTDYTNQLLQAMQRVYGAQNEMCLATQQLSKQLLAYEKQNFALGKGDEEVISTLHYFSKVVDELNLLHTELAKQLADTMVLPIIQFREKDLTEVSTLKDLFGLASNDVCLFLEHDLSMAKYSRLPKKKENEKVKTEVGKEVAAARRKQHLSSLQYYCALNALQYRKQMAMMEPMIGFAHGQINFFKKGAEMFSKRMDSFLSSVADMVQSIQVELEAEAEKMRVSQQELLSVDESVYTPDSDVAAPQINRNLIQKAGYLNLRNKTGLVTTTWERLYFFTQGGNLMCQPRGAVAGGLIQDLDNCSVMAVDCEDRRYCFQITTPNGKSGIILQAESRKENEEWICAINNISRQIYLTDNPEAVAIKLNQTALQAVTPITSFGKKQESSCPSQNLKNSEMENENDKIVPKATASLPEAEELIAPGTPIQFDIVLPATEFLDQNRGSRRTNPFGETEDESFPEAEDSLLQQMFIVRFLGSMAVKTDSTTEVIYEAMRQVLAARAIHNIFRMTESHLMVTSQSLRLIDPQTQVSRANFELTSVTQFAAHQENKRLVGFVIRVPESTGEESLSTYIFESNSEGEKICYAINLGKEIIEVQKDPEALAQLMLSIPLTNDGKYVLLNDQPDDDDGNPNEHRGAESEA